MIIMIIMIVSDCHRRHRRHTSYIASLLLWHLRLLHTFTVKDIKDLNCHEVFNYFVGSLEYSPQPGVTSFLEVDADAFAARNDIGLGWTTWEGRRMITWKAGCLSCENNPSCHSYGTPLERDTGHILRNTWIMTEKVSHWLVAVAKSETSLMTIYYTIDTIVL